MAAQMRPLLPSPSISVNPKPCRVPFFDTRGDRVACVSRSSSHGSAGTRLFSFCALPVFTSSKATERYVAAEVGETTGGGGGSFNGLGGEGGGGSGGGGGGGHNDNDANSEGEGENDDRGGIFGALTKGWNERVDADPQFPFKVLMEQIVGVGASVIGDMACRPNFGLNELDFVFSTLVVGSILNFSLMYMLAPASSAGAMATTLPSIFSACPPGHMFERGAYSGLDRLGTFVYKGAVFAAVGFGAGLLGTFLSNCIINLRKKMDPSFEQQNMAPPTLLNASTWAIHMGLSSNLRYQVINGMEFAMEKVLSPPIFKGSVFCLRALNNVLGGFSFVALARLTGSQKKAEAMEAPPLVFQELESPVSAVEEVKGSKLVEPIPSEKIATTEGESATHGGEAIEKKSKLALSGGPPV